MKHSLSTATTYMHIQYAYAPYTECNVSTISKAGTVADFNLSVRLGREMMKLLDAFNALQIEKCYISDV